MASKDNSTLDLFEATTEAVATTVSQDILWAKGVFEEVTEGAKKRFKDLAEKQPAITLELVEAVLVVAKSKREAYTKAFGGEKPSAWNWTKNVELSNSVGLLSYYGIQLNEIPMIEIDVAQPVLDDAAVVATGLSK